MQKYTKRKDGRFRTRVWDGTYVEGEKHYVDLYSTKSSADLERKVAEFESKRQDGAAVSDKRLDMFQYVIKWIDRTKTSCEPSTKRFYLTFARSTLSSLKGLSFDNFTYNNIQDLFNEQRDHPGNVDKMKVILKQVGRAAEHDRLMPKGTTDEIFGRLRVAKRKRKEKMILNEIDKQKVLSADLVPMEKMFIHLLYYTGLRRSEALALTVDDVQNGFVNVNKALGFALDGVYVKQPKSARGIRKVPIPNALQKELDEYIPTLTTKILFPVKGTYIDPSRAEVITKHLRKKTGLHISLHDFRHNYCTVLCYQAVKEGNITPKKIAELLGDKEDMVMHVYSHIVEEQEKVNEALENALNV